MEKEIARLTKMDQLHRETAANQLLCNEQIESLQDSLGRVQDRCSIIPTLEVLHTLLRVDISVLLKRNHTFKCFTMHCI